MTPHKAVQPRVVADALGVVASSLCAIHCLVAPALLVLGTTVPVSLLEDEGFHRGMVWVVLPAGLFAFGLGCARHWDRRVLALGAAGLVGFVLAGTRLHDLVGETGERSRDRRVVDGARHRSPSQLQALPGRWRSRMSPSARSAGAPTAGAAAR